MKKSVSARDMSLSIGQNSEYINHIENRPTLPSIPYPLPDRYLPARTRKTITGLIRTDHPQEPSIFHWFPAGDLFFVNNCTAVSKLTVAFAECIGRHADVFFKYF